jgi:acetyl esterase/lipase
MPALLLVLSLLWPLSLAAAPPDIMSAADLADFPSPEPDHRIAYGQDPLQYGELRLPDGDGPHPVMVLIHGGCWLSAYDLGYFRYLAQALTAAGFATWNVEYRRVGDPGGGWPGSFEDIARAGDHLRALAADYALDLDSVFVAGHSAGAHFALWYANRPPAFLGDASVPVQGVLALAPAADLAYLHDKQVCGHVIDRLMGGSPQSVPERYAQGSAIDRLPVPVAQTVVLGRHDESWTPVGRRYVAAARELDAPLAVIEAPESGHFEMVNPDSTTWPLVLGAARHLLSGRLAWLSGCWESADGSTREVWSKPRGGFLFGHSSTLVDGRMRFFEQLRVELRDGGYRYVAQPGGREPTVFEAERIVPGEVRFVNAAHDFPQRIEYRREGTALTATVARLDGSDERLFRFRRCVD